MLVLDGRFLLRDDVRDAFDVTVHLDVSAAARARRLPADEAARVLPGLGPLPGRVGTRRTRPTSWSASTTRTGRRSSSGTQRLRTRDAP